MRRGGGGGGGEGRIRERGGEGEGKRMLKNGETGLAGKKEMSAHVLFRLKGSLLSSNISASSFFILYSCHLLSCLCTTEIPFSQFPCKILSFKTQLKYFLPYSPLGSVIDLHTVKA